MGRFVFGAGEWWHADVEKLVNKANQLGSPPNKSDAHTINGKPGPLFPCSEKRKELTDKRAFQIYGYHFYHCTTLWASENPKQYIGITITYGS